MPAGRAIWKGHLRISLVSIPVAVHNATSSSERISFNQLHKDCNLRLKQQLVCPEHGPVDRSEVAKGYEFTKDQYVIVEESDLERLKQAASKAIDITHFVDESELDPIYFDAPYYLVPDGPIAEKPFQVLREALAKSGKVGIGQFVHSQRMHIVALRAQDKGYLMTTLRAADEVRPAANYFSDLARVEMSKAELKLAQDLIENFAEPLDTSGFKDSYQESLRELITAKLEGKEPPVVEEPQNEHALNFMAALEESLKTARKKPAAAAKKKPMAKSIKTTAAAKKRKKA